MRRLRILRDRIRALVARNVVTDEIHEEIQFHIDRRTAELQRQGLAAADARRAAVRRFGQPALVRDRGYDIRGGGIMESVMQDVRYAVRLLWKQRGFSAVALTTLALGIGATTAIFCVVDAALIRPLPYEKPEQLFRITLSMPDRPESKRAPSLVDADHWRSLTQVFAHVGAFKDESMVIVSGREPERISVERVTHDYLPMYGANPILGRGFAADDELQGAPAVAVLGYRFWHSAYDGDPGVIGRTIQFADSAATIVGVLPDNESPAQTKLYLSMQVPAETRGDRQYPVYARVRDGVTAAQATRDADALFARVSAQEPKYAGLRTRLEPMYDTVTRSVRPTLNILLGAVGFVLLIACVNVASLQFARGATRGAELAIRASIGAGRGRLIRQLLTESLVLSLTGAALGSLLAWLVLDLLVANIPVYMPDAVTVTLNLRVLAATIALAVACGLVFGLAPAFRASRSDLNAVLGRSTRGIRTTLTRAAGRFLVAIEIAAAIVLVAGAALMIRSFERMGAEPLGFDTGRFVTIEVTPVDNRADVYGAYYTSLLDRIRELPGVAAAGGTDNLPLAGSASFGRVANAAGASTPVVFQQITSGYFESLGVPLLAGRLPDRNDERGRDWVVVSRRGSAALFPDGTAVGQQLKFGETWRTVIGIVGDVEPEVMTGPLDATQVYLPYNPASRRALSGEIKGEPLVVLVALAVPQDGGRALPEALRRTARSIGPAVIVRRVRQSHEWWSASVIQPRQRMVLLGILGGLGVLLALAGVFGVTSFAVSQRTTEIGVRMAFGAQPGQVVGAMLKDAAAPIAAGIAIGLVGAFFLTRVIALFLYKTEPRDPLAFAAAALTLATCGLVAAWLPARRAAKVDPVTALRAD
jgi:predicted permease